MYDRYIFISISYDEFPSCAYTVSVNEPLEASALLAVDNSVLNLDFLLISYSSISPINMNILNVLFLRLIY